VWGARQHQGTRLLYLRQLEGVGPLEWELKSHGWTDENIDRADNLAEYLFGITYEDTEACISDRGNLTIAGNEVQCSGPDDHGRAIAAWEENFAVLRLFRDESDAFWASVGWDVTDGEGRQLEVMRRMDRPLVCVVKKLHPDAELYLGEEQDEAEAWGSSLAEQARQFKPSR
jgi:hypothetical protein